MKNELSSLIDGELDEASQQALLSALREDETLRAAWDEYHLIGDALRKTPRLDSGLTARVMAELSHEPTVLAPAAQSARSTAPTSSRWTQGALRVAAAVSGVAVVGWLALNSPVSQEKQILATRAPAAPVALAAATPPADARNEVTEQAEYMQPYLMAHQTYSPGSRFDGSATYVRTVASIR